jgi:hypothetical protein
MKLKIYYNDKVLEISLSDTYTEEIILEVLQTNEMVALTKEDNKTIIINLINVLAIEIG